MLGIAPQCVFGVSARDALVARVNGDEHGLRGSGLLEFEDALGSQLLNQRCELLQGVVDETVRLLQVQAAHRVGEMRRQLAEQTLELRGLRGKSALRLRAARERMAAEAVEFEQCVVQLQALRAVHNRMMSATLVGLASDPLRAELSRMRDEIQASMLGLGARKAFVALCARLRERILTAQSGSNEIHAMLSASYRPLNARHGLGLVLAPPPALQRFAREIDMLETGYLPKLGLAHSLRRPQAQFTEQFMRMLVSRIRGIFETASTDIESWNRAASTHVDHQLGERRRNFSQRNEALQRIELAAGELERRIVDLGAHDVTLRGCQARLGELAHALRTLPPPEAPPGRHVAKSSAAQAPRRRAMA